MENLCLIGVVTKVRSNRGYMKVEPHTDFPERFSTTKKALLQKRKSHDVEEYEIEDARTVKDYVVLKLKNVDSFAHAEEFLGAKIFVKEQDRVQLQEGYYYLDSLIGLDVICYDKDGALMNLGNVTAVEGSPVQYRLVVRHGNGSEFQIPFVKEFIKSVSVPEGKIIANIIEGILEGGVDED
jgi:16S rRNA processing protein RimM